MGHKPRSRGSEPAKGKGGERRLARKTGERTEAQKKADAKYFAANREAIREKNRLRMQRSRARERKHNLFEGLPPSDEELSEGSPPPLGKHKRAPRMRVICSPSDGDSPTEVGFDETNTNKEDYGDTFQPRFEDGYDDEGANNPVPSPQLHSQTQPLDATTMAGIQTLREVRIATDKWVSDLAPLEDWPRVFQQHYDAACERSAHGSTQEEVDTFLESVERHVTIGRSILRKLRESPVVCPPSSHEAWGDFLGAGDLMEILYRGISILEVRLDIFAPRGPSSSQGESSIRKWRGLIDSF